MGQMGRSGSCHEINDYQEIWKNQRQKEANLKKMVKGKKNFTKKYQVGWE